MAEDKELTTLYKAVEDVTGLQVYAIRYGRYGPRELKIARRALCHLLRSRMSWTYERIADEMCRSVSHVKTVLQHKAVSDDYVEEEQKLAKLVNDLLIARTTNEDRQQFRRIYLASSDPS